MSIQDDYYDMKDILSNKDCPLDPIYAEMFDRIWFWACDMETERMVHEGKLLQEEYFKWKLAQETELGESNV